MDLYTQTLADQPTHSDVDRYFPDTYNSTEEEIKMLLGLVREAQGYLEHNTDCRDWNKRAARMVKVVTGE